MADMTRAHYQNVATALLREDQRIQRLEDKWSEERHGKHELTPLQFNAIFYSKIVLQNITEDLIENFNNTYTNFNEEQFRQAVKVV